MDIKLLAFFLTIFFVTSVGFALGYVLKSWLLNRARGNLEERLSRMRLEAQDEIAAMKAKAREESEQIRQETSERQKNIDERELQLTERHARLDRWEERNQDLREELDQGFSLLRKEQEQATLLLEERAHLSQEEAREELVASITQEEHEVLARRLHKLQQEGEDALQSKAQAILAVAIQRLGSRVNNDMVSTHLDLDDDLKGKIIGKEGRNIKAFERATGVQLIIDDTPDQISISSFDPLRRVIAKTVLEQLVRDGRIQPARIEELVRQVREEIDQTILEKGQEAAHECRVPGLPKEVLSTLGQLHFRSSYGQNVLQHSIEMAHLANILASELGADPYVARAGALLHDIGKAVDHEAEGSHVEIGRRILQKYGIDESIIKAMQAHHEEYPYETLESRIVQTADAISSARPGARRDNAEMFIQKMEDLEGIARRVEGVEDAYALSAGREIRIFVNPGEVNDFQAGRMARNIAQRVEEEMKYPGEIKVVVVREQRSIEFAR